MERAPPVGRLRCGGNGRHDQQFKLNGETVQKKLVVLNYLAANDMRATLDLFYPMYSDQAQKSKRTTILRWRRDRANLENARLQGKGDHIKIRALGVAKVLSDEAEQELVVWVNELRDDGMPVSTQMLADKARQVAREYGIAPFRASDKWMIGFRRRHAFSMRVPMHQSQIRPSDIDDVAAAFAATVDSTMRDLGIHRVFNADQTAVFFEYVAKKTLHRRGEKTVWVKCSGSSKERATVMLLGDTDGEKYTPFVVFKSAKSKKDDVQVENIRDRRGFGVHVWKDGTEVMESTDLEVFGNPKGWWNGDLSVAFLAHHFADRPSPQEPILLLWDDFSGHWTPDVLSYAKSINVVLLRVPPHATSVSQPADVAWNLPFKCQLRKLWHEDMLVQITAERAPGARFKLKRPNREKICGWIDAAWQHLSSTTIRGGFRGSLLTPSDSCVAAARVIEQLERLSLLEGRLVDEDQDFAAVGHEVTV